MKIQKLFLAISIFSLIISQGCGVTAVTAPSSGGGSSGGTIAITFNGIEGVAANGTSEVIVAWQAATSESAVTYNVYYSTQESNVFSTIPIQITGILSKGVSGLEPDTEYFFGLRASSEAGSFESNSKTKVATTEVMPGSMKNCYGYVTNTVTKISPTYRLIAARGGSSTTGFNGQALRADQTWYYIFADLDKSTLEVWAVNQLNVSQQTGGNVAQITFGYSINSQTVTMPKIDSYAAFKNALSNSQVKNWIASYPNYTVDLSYMYRSVPTWELILRQTGAPDKIITIDPQTGKIISQNL